MFYHFPIGVYSLQQLAAKDPDLEQIHAVLVTFFFKFRRSMASWRGTTAIDAPNEMAIV